MRINTLNQTILIFFGYHDVVAFFILRLSLSSWKRVARSLHIYKDSLQYDEKLTMGIRPGGEL